MGWNFGLKTMGWQPVLKASYLANLAFIGQMMGRAQMGCADMSQTQRQGRHKLPRAAVLPEG